MDEPMLSRRASPNPPPASPPPPHLPHASHSTLTSETLSDTSIDIQESTSAPSEPLNRQSPLNFVASASPSRLSRIWDRFSPPSISSPFSHGQPGFPTQLSNRQSGNNSPQSRAASPAASTVPGGTAPNLVLPPPGGPEAFRRRGILPSGAITPAEEREIASQLSFSLRRAGRPGAEPSADALAGALSSRLSSGGKGGDGWEPPTFRILPESVRLPAVLKGNKKGKEKEVAREQAAGEDEMMVDDEACFVDGWEGKVDFLASLPFELSLSILLHLATSTPTPSSNSDSGDFLSILACASVSHHWRLLALDPVLWRVMFHHNPRWTLKPEAYRAAALAAQQEAAYAVSEAGTPMASSPALGGAGSNYFDYKSPHLPPIPPSLKRAASSFSRAASASSAGAKRAVVAGADRVQSSGAAIGNRVQSGGAALRSRISEIAGELGGMNLVPGQGRAGESGAGDWGGGDVGSTVSSTSSATVVPSRPATPRRLTTALVSSSTAAASLLSSPTLPSSTSTHTSFGLASLPSTSTLSTNAFASPPSAAGSLSRTGSSSALSSLSALPSATASALSSARRSSHVTLASSAPQPPSTPRATDDSRPSGVEEKEKPVGQHLDWPRLFRDRHSLEKRWERGKPSWNWLEGHGDSVYCVQFDKMRVVSGSRDKTIRIWDLVSGAVVRTLTGHEGSVLCLQYDDEILVSGSSDSRILVWDMQTYEIKLQLVGHAMGVLDLCFDKDWIVSCSKDTTTRVWHRSTGALYRTLSGHRGPVNAVQLHGSLVLSASGDALMKLWDLHTGQALRTFSGHSRGLACVHWAPSGNFFVSGSNDKTIKLWDANTGECVQTFTGHADLVRSLWYDEKTQRVVSASYDRTTRVWDAATGKLIQRYRSHASLVFDVAFDVSRIVSCSHDQRILVMDFGEGLDVSKFA